MGEFLGDVGVRNWALNKHEALMAVTELGSEGIAVLGGDVYKRDKTVFAATGDGWHCDRDAAEDSETFVDRSIEAARKYIERYPGSDDIYFVLVPGSEPKALHGRTPR